MSKPKQKKRRWPLVLLMLVILMSLGYFFWKKFQGPEGESVIISKAEKRTIHETVSASGRIFPQTEVKISSDVSGEVVSLYVSEGDSVLAGQLLVKIDPDAYVSAVERGRATVNNAKAQLSISKSQIESSIAQKEQIFAQLSNAKRIHDRNKTLHNDGVISDVELEQSQSNLESLEANLKASEASIRSANQSAEGAAFNVKSAEATLKELRTNLSRTTISAPASGIISSLSIEQGERVVGTAQMAGTEIMRISNLDVMEVQVDVSENDIVKLSLSDSVDIDVDAYIDQVFKGTITEIANSASNLTGNAAAVINSDQVTNFVVKILIEPKSYKNLITKENKYPFRPGMSASVDIFTNIAENVIAVPIQSVTARAQNPESVNAEFKELIFVMDTDTAKSILIETGIQDDEFIEIKNGISVDQEVISGPYSAVSKILEDGVKIKRKEEDEGAKGKG